MSIQLLFGQLPKLDSNYVERAFFYKPCRVIENGAVLTGSTGDGEFSIEGKMLKKSEGMIAIMVLLLFQAEAKAIDVVTPVQYTAMLMAVEFASIQAFDISDNSVSFSNFEKALTDPMPEKDNDSYILNYVLHPLMGSETYLRAREGDFGIVGSIAFSMGASITWEYLVESWIEHPSSQDLLATTGIGWLIGELRYRIKQSNKSSGRGNFWIDPIWTTLEYLDFSITRDEGELTPTISFKFPL